MKQSTPIKPLVRRLLTATVLGFLTTAAQATLIVPVTPDPVLVRDVDRAQMSR